MNEEKVCRVCNKKINNKDNYIELIDYKEGELFDRGYYHNPCYHKQIDNAIMRNKTKLKTMLPSILNKLRRIQNE